MNMISAVTGEVKHDLIGWDSLEEIYTVTELQTRLQIYYNHLIQPSNLDLSYWAKDHLQKVKISTTKYFDILCIEYYNYKYAYKLPLSGGG